MNRRDRMEIVALILGIANGNSISLAEIIHKTYLSHIYLKKYLFLLLENGLLEYLQAGQTYRTTDKGIQFLQIYNQISEMVAVRTTKMKNQALETVF
jgi:predicted transcriptional regulator